MFGVVDAGAGGALRSGIAMPFGDPHIAARGHQVSDQQRAPVRVEPGIGRAP
jgi:hypothetical protein